MNNYVLQKNEELNRYDIIDLRTNELVGYGQEKYQVIPTLNYLNSLADSDEVTKSRYLIITECQKYGYELVSVLENYLTFVNKNAREEFQCFDVIIDEDLERVRMAVMICLGSWSEATECDLNDLEAIKNNINMWISEENLKEVEKCFLGD